MAHELLLAVSTISPSSECTSDEVSSLRTSLGESFRRPENEPYLDGLMRGLPRGLPHVAVTRLTALSLLSLLLEKAGVDSRELILARDAHGRPYAKNVPELDFNLSHSDTHAVCALLIGGGRVGVDVEEPLSPDRAARLWQRYATDGERTRFDSAKPQPWEGFVRLWTLREAIAKQDGRGQPLNFDASAVPPGVCAHSGHLPDTGAALALCVPDSISLTDLRTLPCSLPITWDNTL